MVAAARPFRPSYCVAATNHQSCSKALATPRVAHVASHQDDRSARPPANRIASGLAGLVTIAPITTDEFSDVRYVHETSVRLLASSILRPDELDAWSRHVRSPSYAEALANLPVFGARLYAQLVGTVSWTPADDTPGAARLRYLFVRPFFTQAGIGSLLLRHAETQAYDAGFSRLGTGAIASAVTFFEYHGYEITSKGTRALNDQLSIPISFMRKSLVDPKDIRPRHLKALA